MRTKARYQLTQKDVTGFSFFKRFRYKLRDIVNPALDPKIVMFSKVEKQIIFFLVLSVVVAISIYVVLEFGYIALL